MWDGEPVEVDDMVRIRELQQKLSSDEKISDDEIVELFKLAIRQPKIDSGFREGTMFFLDETPFSQISPLKVRQVIENLQIAPLDKELEQTLSEFLQLIRHVRESSKILRIIDTRTGAQHFAWKGPKEN